MSKTGVILINLGTPDNCDTRSVYSYLKEFLNDPRVIDIPKLLRYILVNFIIVPFRSKKSAHAYQQIWTKAGSPLLVNSQNLARVLSQELGNDFQVELSMRYGSPSIKSAVTKLNTCDQIVAIPLFPQYSSAATGSAIEKLLSLLSTQWNIPSIHIIKDFFNDASFIESYSQLINDHINTKKVDLVLFSYHGLPERHINKSACNADCSRQQACPAMNDLNVHCYRAQCYETSRLIAASLDLTTTQYQVSFQSRLGRTPWIKPYTDLVLPELITKGIKNIAIVCPSFVSDCLETLEEINIRAREQWQSLGGEEFTFIPCINDNPIWVRGLAEMVRKNKYA